MEYSCRVILMRINVFNVILKVTLIIDVVGMANSQRDSPTMLRCFSFKIPPLFTEQWYRVNLFTKKSHKMGICLLEAIAQSELN